MEEGQSSHGYSEEAKGMKGLSVNCAEITVTKPKRNHKGFVDSEGNELAPGDLIVVSTYRGVQKTAIITRFTPRRVYFMMQYCPEHVSINGKTEYPYEDCVQLPYYGSWGPEKHRMMERILKVTEV